MMSATAAGHLGPVRVSEHFGSGMNFGITCNVPLSVCVIGQTVCKM